MNIKAGISRGGTLLPEVAWKILPGESSLFPYYHIVSDEHVPHVSPTYRFRSVREFEMDLDSFLRIKNPMSLDELVSSIRETGTPPKDGLLVTFDDGFRQVYEVVMPILLRKGLPAVFFVNSSTLDNKSLGFHQKLALLCGQRDNLGAEAFDFEVSPLLKSAGIGERARESPLFNIPWKCRDICDDLAERVGLDFDAYLQRVKPYLSGADVEAMIKEGLDIGAHSVDHPLYREISLTEQLEQTNRSMDHLCDQFDLGRRSFAFPHTDQGVTSEFFDSISSEGSIDITFGTSAPMRDSIPFNIQRFSIEKSGVPASVVIAKNRLKRLWLDLTGRRKCER